MVSRSTRSQIATVLKLIIGAVIAVALVKFAFFPSNSPDDPVTGQGDFITPTVTASRGDIENTVSLRATVVRNESVPIKATAAGEIVKVYVSSGHSVSRGAPLFQVKQTSEPTTPDAAPTSRWITVSATGTGTVTLDAIVGQEVTIGEAIGSILPEAFHAEVTVTPDQLYALQSLPPQGELAITDGPAPFACINLTTLSGPAQTSTQNSEGGGSTNVATTPKIRCDIPSDQRVFDGVTGKLTIAGGSVSDVLTLPVTAVEGRYREGRVYLPAQGSAKPKPQTVGLGITDGTLIEITSGLDESTEVLEFVPASEDATDDPTGEQG
ncbi:efflux RND transporter periplasmic adaptor subunit [Nanchangia anserum]|uniref:Efflux RND transporter periplasmic adaptor subunit n=1 Tax=Nanchangia anserum TaxID=2692125 RepID=A0A8I0GCZ1_9ACTO|nr:efflux RND transporter periplasmic adaptor subunit [Nanchangia anserum]MBD3689986.1 efflux RND transporter periplasmic adaptor subunit [Nanchangia anserum]QOX82213.1 efflux RND transporter periplasmic adaptor subunit [Nanchangia anserum]